MTAFDGLERQIGYRFADRTLLQTAMTHKSFSADHYERLEFLGDSLLNCVMAILLCERFPDLNEGTLSRIRASLVKQDTLHEIAVSLGVSECLRLGGGELKAGGRQKPSILADTVESLLGAVFLDSGFERVRETIVTLFKDRIAGIDPATFGKDPKTQLQEFLQARHVPLPAYTVLETRGAAHEQEFTVGCAVESLGIRTTGDGHSRRAAEQQAAEKALSLAADAFRRPGTASRGKPRAR